MDKLKEVFFIISLLYLLLVISGCSNNSDSNIDQLTENIPEIVEEEKVNSKPLIKEVETEAIENVKVEIKNEEKENIQDVNKIVPEQTKAMHKVIVYPYNFTPSSLDIKAGDEVTFNNIREGRLNKALLVGNQGCNKLKSPMLESGDAYIYTFPNSGKCIVVDAITKQYSIKINIE